MPQQRIKFIMMNPDTFRFYWENTVACVSLLRLGVSPEDIIVVQTAAGRINYSQRLRNELGVQVYRFTDDRTTRQKNYIASIKPYLWTKLLKHAPDMQQYDFFVQDSDIVFREIPNFNNTPATANTWYGADTESYTGVEHLNEKGPNFLKEIAPTLNMQPEDFWSYKGHGVGAQWFISHPTLDYWTDVFLECVDLFYQTVSLEPAYKRRYAREGRPDFYFYQTWTAEMTATLYNCHKHGIEPIITDEFNFDWSSSTKAETKNSHCKIIHNSGITKEDARKKHLFFKDDYVNKSPFDEDLSWVNPDYISSEYVQYIQYAKDWKKAR